jgi:hypothetical protein
LVSAAGNQLIGESLHLGKPLLVLPERAHSEQLINSSFLAAMGCGDFALLEEVTSARVRGFLDGLGAYAPALASVAGRMDGTPDVLRVIAHRLASGADAATARSPG